MHISPPRLLLFAYLSAFKSIILMKILLTGADGFLGSNITRELLAQGYEVRTFIIPGHKALTLAGLPIERFEGNLLNAQDVMKAVEGCDAVIHAAASTSVWPTRNEHVKKVNIEGTRNIIRAVIENKIQRLVYVSTASSFGFGSKENPGDETRPYLSGKYGLDYVDSKYEAQQLVLKAVAEEKLPAVIVNPCFMFGPYDSVPSSGAMIVAVCKGKVPGYSTGGRNYIYVKDVAKGVANALKKGRIGECYILGNKNLTYQEIFKTIAETTGSKIPTVRIPPLLTKLYGSLTTMTGKISGKAPTLNYSLALIACDEHYYSPAKAVRELDLPQTPIEVALKEAYEWLKANHYLDK
jgi:dihydroflavonol-4-reductase